MLTATAFALAAATAAAAPAAAALPASQVMPLIITVTAAADISTPLVNAMVKEADAIWRAAGFRFAWRVASQAAVGSVRVIVGGGTSPSPNRLTPLAWINVDGNGMPEPQIYVSHSNAVQFLRDSRGAVGRFETMPIRQRETYLGRALGRALAHEVGHYLMGSSAHALKGLMSASHTAVEFFAPERRNLGIDAVERQRMAARFTSIYMASRG